MNEPLCHSYWHLSMQNDSKLFVSQVSTSLPVEAPDLHGSGKNKTCHSCKYLSLCTSWLNRKKFYTRLALSLSKGRQLTSKRFNNSINYIICQADVEGLVYHSDHIHITQIFSEALWRKYEVISRKYKWLWEYNYMCLALDYKLKTKLSTFFPLTVPKV